MPLLAPVISVTVMCLLTNRRPACSVAIDTELDGSISASIATEEVGCRRGDETAPAYRPSARVRRRRGPGARPAGLLGAGLRGREPRQSDRRDGHLHHQHVRDV